jgi:hypothetical protein
MVGDGQRQRPVNAREGDVCRNGIGRTADLSIVSTKSDSAHHKTLEASFTQLPSSDRPKAASVRLCVVASAF